MSSFITSTAVPSWYYHPAAAAADSGRPPGSGSFNAEDAWSSDALAHESVVGVDSSPWATHLGNASIVVEENNSSDGLTSETHGMNRSIWHGSQIHMGMDLEVFPEWAVGMWTGVLVFLMFVGVTGNVLVPIVVMRTRELRSSTNLLLVNLAAADLLVLLVSLPTALTELHSRPETWVLGQHMCKLVPFVEYCVCHASVLTILVISFERYYYAICQPLRASYTCTKMRACTCILTIWAAAVVLSCPMLILSWHGFANYKDGSKVLVCITDMTTFWACLYINVVTAVFFFVPLVLLILLYLVIGRSLMQDSTSAALQNHKIDLPNMKARKQVVVMLATVTIFFFISLFPFRVFTLWIVWNPKEVIEAAGVFKYYCMLYSARAMLFANSAVNPILYNLTSTKFREAFVKLLCNDRRRQLSRQSTFNTTGTSMSNGRSGSSRPADINSVKRVDLSFCGRKSPLVDHPLPRPNMARYGRQSSFAGAYNYSSISGNSPYHSSRHSSRTREGSVDRHLENRRCRSEEKGYSTEGKRLLENERQVFTRIQEEKPITKGCLKYNSQLEEQEKIVAEMEKLLSDIPLEEIDDHDTPPESPSRSLKISSKDITLEEIKSSGEAESDDHHEAIEEEDSEIQVEEETGNAETIVVNENGNSEILVVRENVKTVLFCESLSTKISLV
ncbi:uncharacterized protein [Palaemon carinicauda]|uniref:uncharacterized protein isoform X1 n=1 Tax=Palaemon carinicauda TaxID=392227 RepID=UPI0035B6180E